MTPATIRAVPRIFAQAKDSPNSTIPAIVMMAVPAPAQTA